MAIDEAELEDEGNWEDGVNWDGFRGDLRRPKTTIITRQRPSLQLHIPICRKALPYKPGSGPPPPRVDLQLPHDSDAFIVDKLILPMGPTTQLNDPRQRRLYYIVGWPDLPAARPAIDATKILDYVSPRTVEDWEYQDALRRDAEEEAAKQAQEAALAAAIAAAQSHGVAAPEFTLDGRIKKKRGRKPKNAKLMEVRAQTPQLDSEQEELLAKKKQRPSLSTPQKSRMALLDAEMEMLGEVEGSTDEGQDEVAEVQMQLENDALRNDATNADLGMGTKSDGVYLQTASGAASRAGSSSRASSRKPATPSVGRLRPTSPRSEPAPPNMVGRIATWSKATSKSALKRAPQERLPFSPSAQQQKASSAARAKHVSENQSVKRISTTPIPLPPRGRLPWATQQGGNKGSPAPIVSHRPPFHVGAPQRAHKPVTAGAETAGNFSSSTQPPPVSNGNGGGFTPTNNNFTPVGGFVPQRPKRPAESPAAEEEHDARSTPTGTQTRKEGKRKAPKMPKVLSNPEPDFSEEPPTAEQEEFVVKRLEGFEIIDGVRWFKVRWEGDWPADQNPTLEPESHISPALVSKYLKRKERRDAEKVRSASGTPAGGGKSRGRQQKQTSLAQWARGYSSVSEAFEGKAELEATTHQQGNGGGGGGDRVQEEEDEAADELLVVDQSRVQGREQTAAEERRNLGAQFAARIASMGSGRRSE